MPRTRIMVLLLALTIALPACTTPLIRATLEGDIAAVQALLNKGTDMRGRDDLGMTALILALDLAVFINGLPIATFELKNKLTKQTVEDAIQQYKRDRDPKELLFQFARYAVHFAVDEGNRRMARS